MYWISSFVCLNIYIIYASLLQTINSLTCFGAIFYSTGTCISNQNDLQVHIQTCTNGHTTYVHAGMPAFIYVYMCLQVWAPSYILAHTLYACNHEDIVCFISGAGKLHRLHAEGVWRETTETLQGGKPGGWQRAPGRTPLRAVFLSPHVVPGVHGQVVRLSPRSAAPRDLAQQQSAMPHLPSCVLHVGCGENCQRDMILIKQVRVKETDTALRCGKHCATERRIVWTVKEVQCIVTVSVEDMSKVMQTQRGAEIIN